MAKAAKKTNNLVRIVFLGGACLTFAYFYGSEPPKTTPKRSTVLKPKTEQKGQIYTEEDYKVKFTPISDKARNAFRPLLAKGGVGSFSGIREDLTGGERGWIYTGLAELDGKTYALLENTVTTEGVFLQIGEKLKGISTVKKISADELVLSGPEGDVRIPIGTEGGNGGMLPAVARSGGTNPVNPSLRGPIGSVQVDPISRTAQDTRSRRGGRNGRTSMSQSSDNGVPDGGPGGGGPGGPGGGPGGGGPMMGPGGPNGDSNAF